MADSEHIRIFDTTLRDGEQAPGFSMNQSQKLELAQQLEILGVDVVEAGFPISSPEDFRAVQSIAKALKKTEVCGLARAKKEDIQAVADALVDAKKPRIHTFIATSPIHMEYKLKKTPEEVLQMAVESVRIAKSLCERVDFSAEDAGRSNPAFLVKVIDAVIEEGADVINIPDTVGYNQVDEYGALIKYLTTHVKNSNKVIFSTHCHDDLGLAVANSLAGMQQGARQIECTINGIGERAGNASLEEIVMNIHTRPDIYPFSTGINTKEIYKTSQLLQKITENPIQLNKAIVGENAFRHESGIHQDGVLKHLQTYEIMKPRDIGIDYNNMVLGKHSGRAALHYRLKQKGYDITDRDELNNIFKKFKILSDTKKEISDEDLDSLM